MMGDRRGALSVGSSKRIESITVAILVVVFGSWTISAHGTCISLMNETGRTHGLTSSRVGGVVSESSFKYFLQFVVYAAMWTGFVLIVLAIYMAELRRNVGSGQRFDVKWPNADLSGGSAAT